MNYNIYVSSLILMKVQCKCGIKASFETHGEFRYVALTITGEERNEAKSLINHGIPKMMLNYKVTHEVHDYFDNKCD